MVKLIGAAAVCISLAAPAEARQWWYIDFSNGVCETTLSDPYLKSPDAFSQQMRVSGIPPIIRIKKDSEGNIVTVTIGADTSAIKAWMMWTSTAEGCDIALAAMKEKGIVATHDDLK